ncbi:MAG: hypothetical protein JNJ59_27440, partial [Deltaproteobacteria bacterium]|nr:hypothetical protein [Deltaproteobacteria bacterium]
MTAVLRASPDAPPPNRRLGAALVGRAEALAWLELHAVAGRLVTVLGLGGIGKSTLVDAFLAARTAEVTTLRVTRDGGMRAALGVVLGLGAHADVTKVERALRARTGFLRLEDAEGLSADEVAWIVATRTTTPGLAWLATSRVPLDGGDDVLRLGPLPHDDARALFERLLPSDASAPGYAWNTVVAKLDGFPLALRLAAPWTRWSPPDELERALSQSLALLDDEATDGRTLEGALRWASGRLG